LGPTVACVYKPGAGFNASYVYRLQDGFARHCTGHRFVCLTNEKLTGVETIPLETKRPGWWLKTELFRPGLFEGQVFYSDLDTMIVGDVTDMVHHRHTFTMLSDPYRPERTANSSLMAWRASPALDFLFTGWRQDHVDEYSKSFDRWGDQAYFYERMQPVDRIDRLFPDRIFSYKHHIRRPGRVPATASIVYFHGKPRPADIGWQLPRG
jgi:hypothetical protein